MRRRLVLAAFLLSAFELIAQSKDVPSTSASSQAQDKSDSTKPPASATVGDGQLSGGRLIHKAQPKYPKAAKKAHIEGTVVLSADIEKDGTIGHLEAVSGPAELIPAAMESVRKWRYSPFLYRNEPIAVRTDISVNFSLSQ